MKVEEGYVKCSTCNGTGKYRDFTCQKCQGEGVTDWITNAMFRERPLSALDSINVRRMLLYVRKTIEKTLEENFLETADVGVQAIAEQLDYCKKNRMLCDYKVSEHITPNEMCFDIIIKPTKSMEIIDMQFEVTRSS